MNHRIFFHICPLCAEEIVGILRKSRCIHLPEIAVFRLIRCRLTDVVNSCPDELSTGIGGISVHNDTVFRIFGCPAGSTVTQSGALFVCFDQCRPIQREMIDAAALYNRRSLASVDDPVRILFMVLFIIFFRVIISRQLHDICTFLCVFPWHIVRTDGHRCHITVVPLSDRGNEASGDLLSVGIRMGVWDLVTNAPHDNRGVIAIPTDPAADILFHPVLEKSGVIIWILGHLPHVKGFGQYQKSHLVRQFHHFHCRHVVRSPQGIDAHGAHEFELTAHGFLVESRAQCSEVMMVTGTVQANLPAI